MTDTSPQAAPLQGDGVGIVKDVLAVTAAMSLTRCLGLGFAPLMGPVLNLALLDALTPSQPSQNSPNISPAMAVGPPTPKMGGPSG